MNFKSKGCKNNGITLIALVITIIVLLILAGVTIMMLMGGENAPQKASEAVEKDAIAGAKDEVAMEAQSALLDYFNKKYVEGSGTDSTSIQSEVAKAAKKAVDSAKNKNKQLLSDSGVTDNTITLKTKSYTVTGTIDENGSITWGDIVASTGGGTGGTLTNAEKTEKINDAIGQTVNYGEDITNYNKGWRIFYSSEKEMFLISTGVVKSGALSAGDYKDSNDVFSPKSAEDGTIYTYKDVTYGADYNEKWKKLLDEKNKISTYVAAQTAYLCDPKNWTDYISKTSPQGTYAVGGPTRELFVLSWNEAVENGGNYAPTTTVSWGDNEVELDGYKSTSPSGLSEPNTIRSDILDGLYLPAGFSSYWLASPSSGKEGGSQVSDSGYIDSRYTTNPRYFRIIVSIPISNVQIEENGTVRIVP